jgi:Acetyltransferase (GNAT) domain
VAEALRLEATHDVDPQTWDERVAALDGSVFHTHAWAMFLQRDRGGRPVFVRWVDAAGEVCALAIGLLRTPLKGRLGRAVLTVSFDAAPAVADGAARPHIDSLVDWARSEKAVLLTLDSFDSGARPWHGDLHDRAERIEFLVPPSSEQELRRRMRRTRAAVHRAERLGVEVESVGETHVPAFARLFDSTLTRLRREKGVALGGVDPNRFTESFNALLSAERARLYLARLDDEYVAGCVFGIAGPNAFYLYNGSSETALRVGATPFILLRAMTDLSEEGFTRINLGGVPATAQKPASPDHGLYTFKLGLGGEPSPCLGGRLTLSRTRLRLLDLARSVRAGSVLRR